MTSAGPTAMPAETPVPRSAPSGPFPEAAVDQGGERVDGLRLVRPLRRHLELGALGRRQQQDPQDRLAVHRAAVAPRVTRDRNRFAAWTKRAAARACSPSRLRIRTSRRVTACRLEDLARHGDRASPWSRTARATSTQVPFAQAAALISIGRLTPVTISTRGDRNGRLTFVGVPPNMSVSTSACRPADLRMPRSIAARAARRSSAQPIETAPIAGMSPTIVRAALTSSAATRP